MRDSVVTLTSFIIFIWATIFGIQFIPSKFDQQTSVQVTRQLQKSLLSSFKLNTLKYVYGGAVFSDLTPILGTRS